MNGARRAQRPEYCIQYRDVDPADHTTKGGLRAAALSADEVSERETASDTESGEDVSDGGNVGVSVDVDTRKYGDSPDEIAALSRSVMNVSDWREMEAAGLSSREFVADKHGADPAEHRSETSLREAIEEAEQ